MFVSSLKHNRGESCLKEGRNWVNVIVEAFGWVEALVLTFRARNFHCLDKRIGELNWNRAIGEIAVTFDLRSGPNATLRDKKAQQTNQLYSLPES